jgi:hypothetical protein
VSAGWMDSFPSPFESRSVSTSKHLEGVGDDSLHVEHARIRNFPQGVGDPREELVPAFVWDLAGACENNVEMFGSSVIARLAYFSPCTARR